MNAQTLANVQMSDRDGFVPGPRPERFPRQRARRTSRSRSRLQRSSDTCASSSTATARCTARRRDDEA
jgi:hypothetical protein